MRHYILACISLALELRLQLSLLIYDEVDQSVFITLSPVRLVTDDFGLVGFDLLNDPAYEFFDSFLLAMLRRDCD